MTVFTGLVQSLGTVRRLITDGAGVRLEVSDEQVARGAMVGDSIAINGCGLTVVAVEGAELSFDAGPETLQRTNLGRLAAGDSVNLESSLRLGDPLGGHWVTGHIDGVGALDAREDQGDWCTMWFRTPAELTRQMASKGSVAVDGVSLTLVDVEADRFSVALIPHTLRVTTLGLRAIGDEVNLETDVLAKYIERQMAARM